MKHFLANSNEDGRTSSSSDFDERNLREYYLVPFEMGIKGANAGPSANDVFIDWYAGNLPYAVTPLKGIRNKVGTGVRVRYAADNNNNSATANIAAESDVAIAFVGNNPTCNGTFGRWQTRECRVPVELEAVHYEAKNILRAPASCRGRRAVR